ncbi:MAG: hypothetical protein AAGE01_07455 [Pseudomonadota bacterium]
MKTEHLNDWLALAANFGVILGIGFLVYELQQANTIAQGEARDRNSAAIFDISQAIAENERLVALTVKLRQATPELSETEHELARRLAAMYVSQWGKLVIQNSTGLLPESSLSFGQAGIAATFDQYPGLAPHLAEYLSYRGVTAGTTNPVWRVVWTEISARGDAG